MAYLFSIVELAAESGEAARFFANDRPQDAYDMMFLEEAKDSSAKLPKTKGLGSASTPMNTAQAPAFRQAIWNTSAGILRSWSARRGCGTWGNRTSQ